MTDPRSAIDVFGEEPETEDAPEKSAEERAEELFCDRIWRIYERRSREQPTRTEPSPPLPRWTAPASESAITNTDEMESDGPVPAEIATATPPSQTPTIEDEKEEAPMPVLGREEACLAAVRELCADGARVPMVEIAQRAGLSSASVGNLRTMVRNALAPHRGKLLDWGARANGGVFLLDGSEQPAPTPVVREARPAAAPATDDPAVVMLKERRAVLLRQVDKIDSAINALEA